MWISFIVMVLFGTSAQCQVLDVNGDNVVGPHEAIAVHEQWKGPASQSNAHNHLGQTWTGNRNPLRIQGNFPPRIIIGPAKSNGKGFSSGASAPLILDNTATPTNGYHHPDLLLQGTIGQISANEHSGSELHLVSNSNVWVWLDSDDSSLFPTFSVLNGERAGVAAIFEDGDMNISGTLTTAAGEVKIDHPLDPAAKFLTHSDVSSPERMNVYSGNVLLDEEGEALVQLPDYFEAFNADYRYQLTCIGGSAPVYVAEEISDNRFRIAGGLPAMKVSWQVSGVRHDPHAKAHPMVPEQEKSDEEKGKFLHPDLYGEPKEKGIDIAHRNYE